MNRLLYLPLTAACLALAAPAMAAQGNAYPNKPIRLIVPFPPGGGTDLVSRIMQPALSADLGQQVLLDNRGGAQGTLARQSPPPPIPMVIPW
jgi:tripartite-type tricarboxylate transporter receptor subunit TctC